MATIVLSTLTLAACGGGGGGGGFAGLDGGGLEPPPPPPPHAASASVDRTIVAINVRRFETGRTFAGDVERSIPIPRESFDQ